VTYNDAIKFLVAMIVMMNPLGSLSIFLQLTKFNSANYRRQTAVKCGIAIFCIMLISLWFGGNILTVLGITIASFRVAGGIILLLLGLSMLQTQETGSSLTPQEDAAAVDAASLESGSIAIVPMAIPIIVGPGSISTLMLASNDFHTLLPLIYLSLLCAGLALGMGLLLYYSASIVKIVGQAVVKVITRLMGMIIMAIAVGMLADGLAGLIPALS
jgi:multiple antibiotic resistance protein